MSIVNERIFTNYLMLKRVYKKIKKFADLASIMGKITFEE